MKKLYIGIEPELEIRGFSGKPKKEKGTDMNKIDSRDVRAVFGSFERFNRVLYGGHANDTQEERFFTFAGDTPIFMGASSDYKKDTWCYQAKNGVLMSGLALTPGYAEMGSHDQFSGWFHDSSDIVSEWHHGYMSYELTRFSPYFPDVRVKIEVYPLNPHDGFLVHYEIATDQHVVFCAGFGGITPFFGRFEYHASVRRDFSSADCENTMAELCADCAYIRGPNNVTMRIAADFACEYSLDSADAMEEKYPSLFLSAHGSAKQIVKLRRNLEAGENFSGNILVLRNASAGDIGFYLGMPDVRRFLRGRIREKFAFSTFHTPDAALDATFPDTILALDAAFHGNSFYHGAIGYHAPFLGWRGWYAPTLLGWSERVKSAIRSHFATITSSDGVEKVWWDGADRPDLDHEGTQYHHLANSSGHLTALLHRDDIYNMQEVAVDMTLYYLEHTGDLETASEIYDRLCEILDWEERILDPDGDGLYQNFLNTWISDGHSYNGAGCAQASSYNYSANLRTAELGRRLGKDVKRLELRAEKIQSAFQNLLWQDRKGIPAESIDTIGNCLVHDAPELSSVYLAADCGNTDPIQTWRMLRWVERNIRSIQTAGRGGKLCFSSGWLPKKYSTCGIFPAENACLALTWFQIGQTEKAMEIVNGLVDAFSLSPYPGSITHVLSAHGGTDDGDIDFTDVSSCYLRLLIEGLWGIRLRLSRKQIDFSPGLPAEWNRASISLPDIAVTLCREKLSDIWHLSTRHHARIFLRLPMRYAQIDQVWVNGAETDYRIIPEIGRSRIEIETDADAALSVVICYCETPYPVLRNDRLETFSGNLERIDVRGGTIEKYLDFQGIFSETASNAETRTVRIETVPPGIYDCLVQARCNDTSVLLPLTVHVLSGVCRQPPLEFTDTRMIDLSPFFNASLATLHKREFRSPRPEGYSIGMRLNGRYAWEWNHCGHNALNVDDSGLRNAGGVIRSKSGIPFATPQEGDNCVSVSLWDSFPDRMVVPLAGRADGLAVLLCGTTNAMQSYVVNAELKVFYRDNSAETVKLIPPENFDDFLIPAYQRDGETLYFSENTHGLILKIRLDPEKELKSISMQAVANEVIVNLLGVTLLKNASPLSRSPAGSPGLTE